MFKRIAAPFLALAGFAFSQPLSFEVASVKPSGPLDPAAVMSGKAHVGISIDKARVDVGNANLMGLICWAYKIKPNQVAGNPAWLNGGINADRFDILAKMPEGATEAQAPEMMQTLLAERFHLQVHHEQRDQPVYALIVGKGGPKLKQAEPEAGEASAGKAAEDSSKAPAKGEYSFGSGDNKVTMKQSGRGMTMSTKETGTVQMVPTETGSWRMDASGITMEAFATLLSQYAGRPVLDQTELKGRYQVSLELSMDTIMTVARNMGMNTAGGKPRDAVNPADAASEPSAGGSLFASVQQLGLKLESRKAPYDMVVIDRVEKAPTEN